MTFVETIPLLLDGTPLRRRTWFSWEYIQIAKDSDGNSLLAIHTEIGTLSKRDIEADDWVIVAKAPAMDQLLLLVEKLQIKLQEAKNMEAMSIVLELRHLLNRIIEDDKRNKP